MEASILANTVYLQLLQLFARIETTRKRDNYSDN